MAINFLTSGPSESHYTVREAVQLRASVRVLASGSYLSGLITSIGYDTDRYKTAQVYINSMLLSGASTAFQLQGSVDNSNWQTLTSSPPTSATGLMIYSAPSSGYLLPWTRILIDNRVAISAGCSVIETVDVDFFR